jgi:hypothetical protein
MAPLMDIPSRATPKGRRQAERHRREEILGTAFHSLSCKGGRLPDNESVVAARTDATIDLCFGRGVETLRSCVMCASTSSIGRSEASSVLCTKYRSIVA